MCPLHDVICVTLQHEEAFSDGDEALSDLSDSDANAYLVPPVEVGKREELWKQLHGPYMQERERRRRAAAGAPGEGGEEGEEGEAAKKGRGKNRKHVSLATKSVGEAASNVSVTVSSSGALASVTVCLSCCPTCTLPLCPWAYLPS